VHQAVAEAGQSRACAQVGTTDAVVGDRHVELHFSAVPIETEAEWFTRVTGLDPD
jgi:hypothetical protein